MPELPEVETTCRGIRPHLTGHTVEKVVLRETRLRWPVDSSLPKALAGKKLEKVSRRAKYILMDFSDANLVIHLGMSGSLRVLDLDTAHEPGKHDHVDISFSNGKILRFCDPRRFGAILWLQDVENHKLFNHLGPEPLSGEFTGDYLFKLSRKRKLPIKQFIMNADVVVGVGNIYANEALFLAGIHPDREVGRLSRKRLDRLVEEIKKVLKRAIKKGGTSLKDFEKPDGKPGYFVQELNVYGREGEPCVQCGRSLKSIRMNNRATVFCSKCQN